MGEKLDKRVPDPSSDELPLAGGLGHPHSGGLGSSTVRQVVIPSVSPFELFKAEERFWWVLELPKITQGKIKTIWRRSGEAAATGKPRCA